MMAWKRGAVNQLFELIREICIAYEILNDLFLYRNFGIKSKDWWQMSVGHRATVLPVVAELSRATKHQINGDIDTELELGQHLRFWYWVSEINCYIRFNMMTVKGGN